MAVFVPFWATLIGGLREFFAIDENFLGFQLAEKSITLRFNSIRCANRCRRGVLTMEKSAANIGWICDSAKEKHRKMQEGGQKASKSPFCEKKMRRMKGEKRLRSGKICFIHKKHWLYLGLSPSKSIRRYYQKSLKQPQGHPKHLFKWVTLKQVK